MKVSLSPVNHFPVRSRRGAFSLLEVAIALVIFVIGAIALLRIFPTGLNVLEDTGNRRIASQMSQNLLTAYNSGDLASTTPDAIYDADSSGLWNDYPLSAIGLKRQSGTVPTNPDDFGSSKDALKYIRGEKQGISAGAVYTNNIVQGRVLFYKEGSVSGVTIDSSGQLDFRNARYLVSNRADLDASTNKADFRQPYLDEVEGVPASNGVITLQRPAIASTTYTLIWPFRRSNTIGDVGVVSGGVTPGTVANDYEVSNPTVTGDALVCPVKVFASSGPTQANIYLTFNFSTTDNDTSLRRATFICKIVGPQGDTGVVPTPSSVLPIRAPSQMRGNCTYYVSSTWNNGTNGAYDQPMVLPATYVQGGTATVAVVPSKLVSSTSTIDPTLLAPLRFRQELGSVTATRDAAALPLPTTTATDVDGITGTNLNGRLTQVSLDYDVRDWEYISEDVSQFGTPFPGDTTSINTGTAEGLSQFQFQFTNPLQATPPTPMARGDVREIRTRVGNVRGPVQIKGLYNQSSQFTNVTFDPRAAPHGGTTSPDYTRQVNALARQGRFYLPARLDANTSLSHARVYYRSRAGWVQQMGVTAPHYVPFDIMNTAPAARKERWREYFRGNDKVLYFHAADAGKVVEVVHGPDLANAIVEKIEIRPDVLFTSTMPSNVPTAFGTPFPTIAGDPRSGQFYLARSRDSVRSISGSSTDIIFDVRRPEGTSGVSVRTLWLNNDRYAQEIAQ